VPPKVLRPFLSALMLLLGTVGCDRSAQLPSSAPAEGGAQVLADAAASARDTDGSEDAAVDAGAPDRCAPAEADTGPAQCDATCPGDWHWTVFFDDTGCALRPAAECGSRPSGDPGRVFVEWLANECQVGSYTVVRVDFAGGCATRLLVKQLRGRSEQLPASITCVAARLADKRWSCAADLACGQWEYDTLP
jgi:hypothetical protein